MLLAERLFLSIGQSCYTKVVYNQHDIILGGKILIIGIPREVKQSENRVGMTPGNVAALVQDGHTVYVGENAGLGSGFTDEEYVEAGAEIKTEASDVWSAEMVIKVKEPLPEEFQYFREGLILFAYLHLAPALELTDALLKSGVISIAYETMVDNGTLPLLTPMSEVAGRMSVQIGAHYLEKQHGGQGILLGGIPGVASGHIVIIGGGTVGYNAAKIAIGLGARVTILDLNAQRLAELEDLLDGQVETLMSNTENIEKAVMNADVVIGSVLIPGAKAPVLVTEEMVKQMKEGAVMVDVAIDQGGNFETSTHATTHDNPIYVKHGVIHYTVSNIPGAVPRTATIGLTNVTLRYAQLIANQGIRAAAVKNSTILTGVNTYKSHLTQKGVASSQKLEYTELSDLI